MKINNTFTVSLPPNQAWAVLMDVEAIAPCMPGAEIIEVIDENTYRGRVSVRLGPVALTFEGTAEFEMIDEAGQQARLCARGSDHKGRGGAEAKINFSLAAIDEGTRVEINTDLQLSGSVAQYGRGAGMISDLASLLIGQFATNLNARLAEQESDGEPASDGLSKTGAAVLPVQPKSAPISGLSLGLRLLWNAIKRLFGVS